MPKKSECTPPCERRLSALHPLPHPCRGAPPTNPPTHPAHLSFHHTCQGAPPAHHVPAEVCQIDGQGQGHIQLQAAGREGGCCGAEESREAVCLQQPPLHSFAQQLAASEPERMACHSSLRDWSSFPAIQPPAPHEELPLAHIDLALVRHRGVAGQGVQDEACVVHHKQRHVAAPEPAVVIQHPAREVWHSVWRMQAETQGSAASSAAVWLRLLAPHIFDVPAVQMPYPGGSTHWASRVFRFSQALGYLVANGSARNSVHSRM